MVPASRRFPDRPLPEAFATGALGPLRETARRNASSLASAMSVAAMIGSAYLGGHWTAAVYALSFWHYYLYWLAYRFGAIPLGVFKRDAIAMKTVSLVPLACLYVATPLDAASLAVVAAGFLLNGWAAATLGSDRTYYGYEVADLPQRRITAFPYSLISHPMLAGNVAAFGGTLLNADFRADWWPLAVAHVAANLGLWIMELAVTPQRRGARRNSIAGPGPSARARSFQTACLVVAAGAALGGVGGAWSGAATLLGAGLGACASAYAYVLYCCYAAPPCSVTNGAQVRREENAP
jgi:hypothetical protein